MRMIYSGICAALFLLISCGCTPVKAEQTDTAAITMQPTGCGLTGAFDAYLYVPYEDGTYRYERVDGSAGDVLSGELIYSFVEDTGFDSYDWKVYAVEQCPDRSEVLAECGSDYRELYRYSPPKRSEEDALDNAKEQGYVVMEDGDVSQGQDKWLSFVEQAQNGKAVSIMLANWYTLDPARCDATYYAAYKEDYPVLYLNELRFDGNAYTLIRKEDGQLTETRYRYLMHYYGDAPTLYATFDKYTYYVLTNDDTATWEDLMRGTLSSTFGDYIPHSIVYKDIE